MAVRGLGAILLKEVISRRRCGEIWTVSPRFAEDNFAGLCSGYDPVP